MFWLAGPPARAGEKRGGHWTGGWANIVIALVLGGMLALFFIWRRDLVANMIGHWFVDFIGNVLPRPLLINVHPTALEEADWASGRPLRTERPRAS